MMVNGISIVQMTDISIDGSPWHIKEHHAGILFVRAVFRVVLYSH